MPPPDQRLSQLEIRTSAAGLYVVSFLPSGKPYGLVPAAMWPAPSAIGAATSDAMTAGLALKQDVAQKGLANGYAPLGSDGLVPPENLPVDSGGTGIALGTTPAADLGPTALTGVGTTAARSDHVHLSPTPAQIGAAPAAHTHAQSAITGLTASLAALQPLSAKGAALGYAPLDAASRVPAANLPAFVDATFLAPIEGFAANLTPVQADNNKLKMCTAVALVTVTLPALAVGTTIRFLQGGTGQILFAPAGGQTLNSLSNFRRTTGRYANAIATCVATNEWNLAGALAA
jgi:hypothetical protein